MRIALLVAPLAALWSCGGTASKTRHDETTGGTAGSSGGSSKAGASAVGGLASAGMTASNAGTAASDAGTAGASTGGAGASGTGGASDGGAADGGSTSGAGGENCVDVCALHGPSCCVAPEACVSADARCVIEVFTTKLVTIPYQYADVETVIAQLPQLFAVSVSTADIERARADPPASGRFEMRLTPAASALYGDALEHADNQPFRLSCDGQRLFVGIVYMLAGAAAIDAPVLHVSRDVDDSVILRLGAQQGAWGLSSSLVPLAARQRLDQPHLRATLCLAGALPAL
jgi:hypothetical protein